MQSYPVLIFNAGSSSIKFALIDGNSGQVFCSGLLEHLYHSEAVLHFSTFIEQTEHKQSITTDASLLAGALAAILALLPKDISLQAIGHRVVHGGKTFTEDILIKPTTLALLKETQSFAPLHNPANIAVIETLLTIYPKIPQVAVFDTTFHSRMPAVAYRYALPKKLYTDEGIRRYGFHGTSHHYISLQTAQLLGMAAKRCNLISAHLGNGCSLCAIKAGRSVDTTMGFTPQGGVPMGTRSGDIDPGLLIWLVEQKGYDGNQLHQLLNKQSGLLGLSGVSLDVRKISQAQAKGNEDAALALAVFCYQVAKQVASMWVPLQRVDALVFTGGIGENAMQIRTEIVGLLGFLGLKIDHKANSQKRPSQIHAKDSKPILVIPTQEEWMIAKAAVELVGGN